MNTQDFKPKQSAVFAIVVILFHRVCVGIIVGSTIAPDRDASYRQVWALVASFGFLFVYLAAVRPFLVPAANFFESLVVLTQMLAVSLNLWLLADDMTVLGLTLTPEEVAARIHYLMLGSLACMHVFPGDRPPPSPPSCKLACSKTNPPPPPSLCDLLQTSGSCGSWPL